MNLMFDSWRFAWRVIVAMLFMSLSISWVSARDFEVETIIEGLNSPTDVTVASNGKIYWTCTAAGVIAFATPKD
ncbi:MAG: hypothetical protein JKY51_04480 [Opitutaceae bacterium]|nr:hypothetical protein [Opitutaceae bacterium]